MNAFPPLIDIPDELKLSIIRYLDVSSRSRLSRTCHVMHHICQDKVLWDGALKKNYALDFDINKEQEMSIKPIRSRSAFRFEWRRKHGLMIEKPRIRIIGKETIVADHTRSSRELYELPLNVQTLIDNGMLNREDLNALSTEEWKIINNDNIFHWINNRLISLDDALNLSYAEVCKLSSHWIHQLLLGEYLDLEQAINLNVRSFEILDKKKICRIIERKICSSTSILELNDLEIKRVQMDQIYFLICKRILPIAKVQLETLDDISIEKLNRKGICQLLGNRKMTINNGIELSEYGLNVLESEWICLLICGGKIKLEDAVNPAFSSIIQRLDSEWIFRLISDKILSVDEARELHPDSFRNLNSEWIYKLIQQRQSNKKLSLIEAKELNEKQFNNLNSVWIYRLIDDGKITIQEACELSEAEGANLNSEWIYKLIECGYCVSVADAKALPYYGLKDSRRSARDNLDSEWIWSLISGGQLEVKDAIKLTRDEFKKLNHQWIAALIRMGKLSVMKAQDLSDEQIKSLNKQWVYKIICPDKWAYDIFSVELILHLIQNKEAWIENRWICQLIANKRVKEWLTMWHAKKLTEVQIKRLGNRWIFKLLGWTYSGSKAKFTIEEAKAVNDIELARLGNKFIVGLLYKKKLTFEDARKLTDRELARLSAKSICKLICRGEADLRSVLMLSDDAFADLVVFASGRMRASVEKYGGAEHKRA